MRRGGSTDGTPEALAGFLRERLSKLKWTQKRLADEAGMSDTAVSELLLMQTGLTLEAADKLASVSELETTAEQLLRMAGKLRAKRIDDIPDKRTAREEVASRIIESLSDEDLQLATDLLITLKKRKKGR